MTSIFHLIVDVPGNAAWNGSLSSLIFNS